MLLDGRGVAMPFRTAIHLISFKPLLPVERIGAAAIIPPLGNDDTLANRGIGFEYATGGAKMHLSEWPPSELPDRVCGTRCQRRSVQADGVQTLRRRMDDAEGFGLDVTT